MALPPAVETVTVNFGPFPDFQGNLLDGVVTFTPVSPIPAVHVPTGTPVIKRPVSVPFAADTGSVGAVTLPATNASDLTVTDFSYQVAVKFRQVDAEQWPTKLIQLPKEAPAVDLDLLPPLTGAGGTTVNLPAVLSVAGLTGVVTASDLQTALAGTPARASGTLTVAAANSPAAAKVTADYVCTGTAATGGDETAINTAIASLPGADTYGMKGRVVLAAGDYWCSAPIIMDGDDTTLEGQGLGFSTNIHYVPGTAREAAVIVGATRSSLFSAVRNLAIKSGDNTGNLIPGSGHGIIFRSSGGLIENTQVENAERDAYRIQAFRQAAPGQTATLAASVGTTPSASTVETWAVTSTTALPPTPFYAAVNGDPNRATVEVIRVTAIAGITLTVARGAHSSPTLTHSAGETLQVFTAPFIFEVLATNARAIYPGNDGIVIDRSVLNSEFIRCTINGGKNRTTPRTRYGILNAGGDCKFFLCHPYFTTSHGFRSYGGDGNNTAIQGGEYETCTGNTINIDGATGVLISGIHCYGQSGGNSDIVITNSQKITLTGSLLDSIAKHVFISGSDWTIQANQIRFGNSNTAIDVSGASTRRGSIIGNVITDIDPASAGASILLATGVTYIDVHGNRLDRPVTEQGTADYNRVHDNDFVTTNGAGNVVTLVGPHSERWDNRNISDVVRVTANYTAFGRDRVLVDAATAAVTVTLPPSPSGTVVEVVRLDATANTVTVTPPAGSTINGGASTTITGQYTGRRFLCFGTNWTAA